MNEHNRKINLRYKYIISLIILLMLALIVRLFVITIIEHRTWKDAATKQSTKTIYTSAPRGNIYDRNGNLLAGNKQIFTVVFNASGLDSDEINKSALKLLNKLVVQYRQRFRNLCYLNNTLLFSPQMIFLF